MSNETKTDDQRLDDILIRLDNILKLAEKSQTILELDNFNQQENIRSIATVNNQEQLK